MSDWVTLRVFVLQFFLKNHGKGGLGSFQWNTCARPSVYAQKMSCSRDHRCGRTKLMSKWNNINLHFTDKWRACCSLSVTPPGERTQDWKRTAVNWLPAQNLCWPFLPALRRLLKHFQLIACGVPRIRYSGTDRRSATLPALPALSTLCMVCTHM